MRMVVSRISYAPPAWHGKLKSVRSLGLCDNFNAHPSAPTISLSSRAFSYARSRPGGVTVHLIDIGEVTDGLSKLFLTIATAFAEADRDRIRERVKQTRPISRRAVSSLAARRGSASRRSRPTGGVAYGGGSANFNVFDSATGSFWSGNPSSSHVGWTIGGGVEYALTNNWTIKGEYLYADLGSHSFENAAATQFFGNTVITGKINYNASIFRAGVNYKF